MELCPVAGKCGGCSYQGTAYPEQLKKKQQYTDTLFASFPEAQVLPIRGMDNPYHYRCKVQVTCRGKTREGRSRIVYGNYEPSSHRLVEVKNCQIEDQVLSHLIEDTVDLSNEFHLTAFDETRGTGLLRHVLARRGFYSGQVLLVLVTGQETFPGKQNFIRALVKKHPEITSVVHNINGAYGSQILGPKQKTAYGPGTIIDQILGRTFRISAGSFYQINPVQTKLLYETAIAWAGEESSRGSLLDAYCGTGTIGILAAKDFSHVTGVELSASSVRDARANARLNQTDNITFVQADAGQYLAAHEAPETVILDPPRAGCSRAFLESLLQAHPRRIVYISCGPDTQSRDVQILVSGGYLLKKRQAFDLFPFTAAVEQVVRLDAL